MNLKAVCYSGSRSRAESESGGIPHLVQAAETKVTGWHLRFLNRESLLLVNEIGTCIKSRGAQGGKPEEQAAWDLTEGAFLYANDAVPPAWKEISDMGARFAWSGRKEREERGDPAGGFQSTQTWKTKSSATVEVQIDPGTRQFIGGCTLSWHYQEAINNSRGENTHSSQQDYKADIQWTLKLGLNSVEAGHLGFNDPVITIDSCKCYKDHDSQGIFQTLCGGIIVDVKMSETVANLVKQRLEISGLAESVRKGLEQQAGFIFLVVELSS
ncbi:hypothetical protein DER46DRAFT_657905 [Fusarium sp. MPI-SDFR-AT-0072]|nr:hypothetical protein DER46DRAFT_657905 [Fusarium sp. MPI-SDFR-AT-0072]